MKIKKIYTSVWFIAMVAVIILSSLGYYIPKGLTYIKMLGE